MITLELEKFKKIIRTRFQLDFKPDFFRFLQDALEARIRACEISNPDDYWELFEKDPDEISHLVNLLTNKETYFLRESPHYLLVTRQLFPDLLRNRSYFGQKIKIVSAGCSSGEEPYSLVIALAETFGEGVTDQIEVIGLDINDEVLHQASMAVFGRYSFRGVAPELRARYFREFPGNRFVLNESIRENVRFEQHNLAQWPFPESVRGADLIFYRNVSIYYQEETRKKIFENLSKLLSPQGYLLMGSVEVSLHDTGTLKMNQQGEVFYFSRQDQVPAPPPPRPSLPASAKVEPVEVMHTQTFPEVSPKSEHNSQEIKNRILEEAKGLAQNEQFDAALDKVESILTTWPDCSSANGLKAYILLQMNRAVETEKTCRQELQKNDFLLLPHLLLGLVLQKSTNHSEAVQQLRKAIYLNPSCWLAHFHLANSYRATGDNKAAQREYNVTLKLLEDTGLKNHGLPVFDSNCTADQMVSICRQQISQLAGK